MKNMKLIIIGNGFDLNHELKTSYSYYRSFLNDNYNGLLHDFEEFPWLDSKCVSDLWKDVEMSLCFDYN